LIDATLAKIIQMIITSVIGMVGIGAAVEGWYWTRMSWWERVPIFAAGILLVDPGTLTDIIGFMIIGLITIIQYRKAKIARSLIIPSAL
jgi:TRAP-type uncharacterized transport system fused permease subunit